MRALPLLLIPTALLLAACETPREACLSQTGRELRTVESLIREVQGNLARGYAIEEDEEVETVRDNCLVEDRDGDVRAVRCNRTIVQEVERPVAIDRRAERRKLDDLLDRRQELLAERDARAQACIARYPE
jgi:hypothetical protein